MGDLIFRVHTQKINKPLDKELKMGELKMGELKMGELKMGELKMGELKMGELKMGELKMELSNGIEIFLTFTGVIILPTECNELLYLIAFCYYTAIKLTQGAIPHRTYSLCM